MSACLLDRRAGGEQRRLRARLPTQPDARGARRRGLVDRAALTARLLAELEVRRNDELDRGVSPGRSRTATSWCSPWATATPAARAGLRLHGESWSFALALRLASYDLLRADGDDPILILDDVFAELDTERRAQLADLVAGAEQVLVTAAVADDVPEKLAGVRFEVAGGEVRREH